MRLEVNTVTGSAAIVGVESQPLPFDYYSIRSPLGELNPTGWTSLDSQNIDAVGPGAGESWDVQPQPDTQQLIELYLRGASTLTLGERLSLGHAYDPSLAGQGANGDLQFQFSQRRSPLLLNGEVVYVTPLLSAGDYNDDGTVNAADYTIWRNTLGSNSDLRADGDGNNKIDRDDYVVWKWSYGHVGPGAGAELQFAAPEPASAVLAIAACLGAALSFSRRRA
jgi:hypothetical protein